MKLNRKRSLKLHLPKHIKNLLNKKKFFAGNGNGIKLIIIKRSLITFLKYVAKRYLILIKIKLINYLILKILKVFIQM